MRPEEVSTYRKSKKAATDKLEKLLLQTREGSSGFESLRGPQVNQEVEGSSASAEDPS